MKKEFNPLSDVGYNYERKIIPLKEIIDKKCIIPANTQLFRIASDSFYHKNMFFSFNPYGCYSTSLRKMNPKIQIWETKINIQIPYRIINIDKYGKINSSLETIYHHFFGVWTPAYRFKQFGHKNRNQFFRLLKNMGDIGWVSSVEDKNDAELFLMNSINKKKEIISFKKIDDKNNIEAIDSFKYVKELFCQD